MAREQRKDVDYFPHECIHGRKMHIIEAKYGNDGYATWFKLLEQLGKANDHFIDISEEMTLMFLTSVFKIDEEKTLLILNDLAKLEAIDKYLFNEFKVIYSHKFIESIKDAYRNRKGEITEYSVILEQIKQKNNQSSARFDEKETNLTLVIPKVEYSIVNKIKEKKIKEELNKSLLSEIKISEDNRILSFKDFDLEIEESDAVNFKTAVWLQKLFIKNLKEKEAPTTHQEKATYKNYVTPIRLMFDSDKVTQEQVKKAYDYLNSPMGEFWKNQILSTETFRKQISKLVIQKTSSNGTTGQTTRTRNR